MKKLLPISFILILLLSFTLPDDWGFYAHRRINRMAVFTLPPEMIVFYKKNLEFITEHAVDPDKRRYSSKFEAVRHYIDLDHWGEYPFEEVPRPWTNALMKYTDLYLVTSSNDTIHFLGKDMVEEIEEEGTDSIFWKIKNETFQKMTNANVIRPDAYRQFFKRYVESQYYEDEWLIDCDTFQAIWGSSLVQFDCQSIFAIDRFSEYGIAPYNLERMTRNLTYAFKDKNLNKILRYSAEVGHYIGDAHVPLHTTENYNGQLTDQVGIHAFWESRLPELFADENYDYFVGKAEYIDNPNEYFWDIVLTSHSYLDSVLLIEKDLAASLPPDQLYCFEDRNGRTVKLECEGFAKAYHERLDGQVERRMTQSIKSVGDVWLTAWINAGEPRLSNFGNVNWSEEENKTFKRTETSYRGGKILGRKHD